MRVYTDDGRIGLGETAFGPETVEAWVHEDGAGYLLGKDATQLDWHWNKLNGFGGKVMARAADMSGLSAIDMALWDLYAQRAGVPLYEALGRTQSSVDPRLQYLRWLLLWREPHRQTRNWRSRLPA